MEEPTILGSGPIPEHPSWGNATVGMLLDLLEPLGVLRAPDPAGGVPAFRWVTCAEDVDIPESAARVPWDAPADQVIHLCSAAGYLALRQADANAFCIVCCPGAVPGADERAIALGTERPLVYVYLLVKEFLGQLFAWEQTLASIVRNDGGVTTALDASRSLIPRYLFVSDKNGYVLAQSSYLEPPDPFHQSIALSGFVPVTADGSSRTRLAEDAFAWVEGDGQAEANRLAFPLHLDHALVGVLSMACPDRPPSAGLRDLVRVLARYVETLCAGLWSSQSSVNIPRLRFFDLLLAGKRFDRMVAGGQLEELRIPPDSWFKVILVDIDEGAEPAKASLIAMTFISDKRLNARCFLHNGSLVVLQYAPTGPDLTHLVTERILSSYDYTRFDVAYGVSDPFHDIASLRHAYHEARIALDLRKAVTAQREIEQASRWRGSTFFFYEALPFFLVDPAPKDEGLMRFIFDMSFLPTIMEEDAARGTNDFRLLWTYLINERNATKTAQMMYVHRNTVLYRIERLQERFRIDLDDPNLREKLCCDYRMYFLSSLGKPRWTTP